MCSSGSYCRHYVSICKVQKEIIAALETININPAEVATLMEDRVYVRYVWLIINWIHCSFLIKNVQCEVKTIRLRLVYAICTKYSQNDNGKAVYLIDVLTFFILFFFV